MKRVRSIGKCVFVLLLCAGGCAGAAEGSLSAPVTSATTGGQVLPISVMAADAKDSNAQDPSILIPSSCTVKDGVATATGTFKSAVPESYIRVGAVVELYVYAAQAAPGTPGTQLATLSSEHPFTIGTGGGGPWTVTAPLNASLGAPATCQVGVQSTHAFQGAGHAGG